MLEALAEARSNRREAGTGADVFRHVARHRVTPAHAVARAALQTLVAPSKPPRTPGFDVDLHPGRAGHGTLAGSAEARRRRTGATDELDFLATVRPRGKMEATVGGERLTLEDLGEETRGSLIMAALPELAADVHVPEVLRLIVDAARELPPDTETPEGLARRDTLMRVLLEIFEAPSEEELAAAAELVEVMRLPAGSPERRRLEEHVWALCDRGRPSEPLRALAQRLGFASAASPDEAAEAAETVAS